MNKKISKLAAVILTAIVIAVGIVPMQSVKAAGSIGFIVKTSSASVKPGDTITAELWLPTGGDVVSFVGNFTYDTKMFDMVENSGTQGPVCSEADAVFSVDQGSISIMLSFDEPYNAGGLVYTIALKVKDTPEAGATGALGFDFCGGQAGADGDNPITIPSGNSNVEIKVTDSQGNVLDNGNVALTIPSITIPLDTIAFKDKVTPLEEGKTAQLTILYNPENTTDIKDVTWSSSDPSVATIDQNGLVTAVKEGTTTIAAKVGDKEISYELTVTAKKTEETYSGNNNNSGNNNSNADNGSKESGTKDTAKAGNVTTGDISHVLPITLISILSLGVIILVVMINRKKRVNR